MSYEAAVAWSIVRSLLAGALCWTLARVLRGSFQQSTVSGQPENAHRLQPVGLAPRLHVGLVLVPFFMPGLVVGYAYRNASMSLVQSPLLNELLYLVIVVAQLTPVVVLALEWLPAAALRPSGVFLLELTGQSGRRVPRGERLRANLAGELPRQFTAGAIAALLCFQEVEVATLMQARGWAEWIFTKQAGGVELAEVLPFLVLPVGYGLLLTLPVLAYWTVRHESRPGEPVGVSPRTESRDGSGGSRPPARLLVFWVVAGAWLLVVIWPVTSLALGAYRGAGLIRFRSALWQEIGDALVLGVTVTLGLWVVLRGAGHLYDGHLCPSVHRRTRMSVVRSAAWAVERPAGTGRVAHPTAMWRVAVIMLLLPGLLGSLALGLTIFEICQRLGVQPSYSPVPLVLAMVLFLLPRALAMQAMLRRNEQQSRVFLAESLTQLPGPRGRYGAAILWHIRDTGRFWTLALLFWWSYLELTLPALLRPAGMAPAPLRLYNFLHYGHIPGLAAMLYVVLLVPVALLIVVRRLWMIDGVVRSASKTSRRG